MISRHVIVMMSGVALAATGCAYQGLNSLALPGTVGRGPDAVTYNVQIANVAALESNSPVMLHDVVVGSIVKITADDWHADVQVSVKPNVVVPANAVATVGQTSLLGSMHVALDPPLGHPSQGRLQPGATLGLNKSSTYPSTEQTLSSLSAVLNGGGLGQIGDVIHNVNTALSGREPQIRELLTRLDTFVRVLDEQHDNIIASIQQLNRFAGTIAAQRDVIDRALKDIPPALDVLIKERPTITTALEKLGSFSDTAKGLVHDSKDYLVRDLQNLEPALRSLADVGPDLSRALAYATTLPFTQSFIDRAVRGDYVNIFGTIDFTIPRVKRGLLQGTRWGENHAKLVPAPGDPWYATYTYQPLSVGVDPPPPRAAPPVEGAPPTPPVTVPLSPVVPPSLAGAPAPDGQSAQIFAGPYGAGTPSTSPPAGPDWPPIDVPSAPAGGG